MQISKRQTKKTNIIRKLLEETLKCPLASHCGGHVLLGKLKYPDPSIKDHIVLDDGINVEKKSNFQYKIGNIYSGRLL